MMEGKIAQNGKCSVTPKYQNQNSVLLKNAEKKVKNLLRF
jgi:hypothetical protein